MRRLYNPIQHQLTGNSRALDISILVQDDHLKSPPLRLSFMGPDPFKGLVQVRHLSTVEPLLYILIDSLNMVPMLIHHQYQLEIHRVNQPASQMPLLISLTISKTQPFGPTPAGTFPQTPIPNTNTTFPTMMLPHLPSPVPISTTSTTTNFQPSLTNIIPPDLKKPSIWSPVNLSSNWTRDYPTESAAPTNSLPPPTIVTEQPNLRPQRPLYTQIQPPTNSPKFLSPSETSRLLPTLLPRLESSPSTSSNTLPLCQSRRS